MSKNLTTRTTIENLADALKDTFTKRADFTSLKATVDGLVSSGAEANVIEQIKVNGTVMEIANKTVNIPVPVNVSDLVNDLGFQTESDVADAIAKIIDDAPESLDTLKEIADWINNHADSVAEMNEKINANGEDIEALEKLIGTLPETAASTTVIEYISEVVDGIDLSKFLTEDDILDFTVAEIESMLAD